jgi:hypothetical protein
MANITDIVTRLLQHSDLGKLSWKPTPDEGTFIAVVGGFSVAIKGSPNGALVLRILNRAGVEIDRLTDRYFEGRTGHTQLGELFNTARRAALEVNSLLDELLKELEALGDDVEPEAGCYSR